MCVWMLIRACLCDCVCLCVTQEYDYTWLVNEIKHTLPRELDFTHEASNAERCRANLNSKHSIVKGRYVKTVIVCRQCCQMYMCTCMCACGFVRVCPSCVCVCSLVLHCVLTYAMTCVRVVHVCVCVCVA